MVKDITYFIYLHSEMFVWPLSILFWLLIYICTLGMFGLYPKYLDIFVLHPEYLDIFVPHPYPLKPIWHTFLPLEMHHIYLHICPTSICLEIHVTCIWTFWYTFNHYPEYLDIFLIHSYPKTLGLFRSMFSKTSFTL